ncbi:hypothetical protein GYMLUDRAFT_60508 [Collybiopsis luxurians FD-317 M1]|uniref:Uncharacterized protein n=1 Tax=Collybiopsis luxurians FD-317 M1 TaxID=944289 RepID=A0A0D0CSQ1_9AGAR|nr:hypothetical protein GYMLUDRAFT_60508 [Collybiopsis luxurians FD-317 M1]
MANRAMGDVYETAITYLLDNCIYFPGDDLEPDHTKQVLGQCFCAYPGISSKFYMVQNQLHGLLFTLPVKCLRKPKFDLYRWICKNGDIPENELIFELELNGIQVPHDQYAVKDPKHKVPCPVVVEVVVNGQPAKALIDSGSLADFISNMLIDQLKSCCSRFSVNWGINIDFAYQNVKEKWYFDATNLSNYDLILGTPFLFQHQVTVGFNPVQVIVGSPESLPLQGPTILQLASCSMEIYAEQLEQVQIMLTEYAKPICGSAKNTDLPPLRVINHQIPLIDENHVIPW